MKNPSLTLTLDRDFKVRACYFKVQSTAKATFDSHLPLITEINQSSALGHDQSATGRFRVVVFFGG